MGARLTVVQEAPEMTVSVPSSVSWFTLYTMVFMSTVAGAEITTLFAPPFR
ncbi:hypothetical protein D3C74_215240 [compost metagenome]